MSLLDFCPLQSWHCNHDYLHISAIITLDQDTGVRQWHFPTASEAKDPLKAKKRVELATEREERKRTSSSAKGESAAKRSRPPAAKNDDFLELADATSVAVIVPFRDLHEAQKRAEHLKLFVPHMHNVSAFL